MKVIEIHCNQKNVIKNIHVPDGMAYTHKITRKRRQKNQNIALKVSKYFLLLLLLVLHFACQIPSKIYQ